MFDELSSKLTDTLRRLTGRGVLTEEAVREGLREIRRVLLEADVSFELTGEFLARVQAAAVGQEILKAVRPGQQLVKIVYDELVNLLGEKQAPLAFVSVPPTILLMVGLQGSGKTTTAGKLARRLKAEQKAPFLVAADVYRPAAIDQLITLGKQIDVPVFELGTGANPVDIARQGIEKAKADGVDTVIVDTAGRLQIDPKMMAELADIKTAIQPDEVLLVVDAMTGQEAANLTRSFHDQIGITGAILTKMDGDARGGAALSVRQISGQPIKFIGVGEKVEALQPFYPERMASRIVGMGEVLTLGEKAQESVDIADAEKLQQKILQAEFDFDDFLKQMRFMKSMGSLGSIMKLIPGMGKQISGEMLEQGEAQLKRCEAMINSMTTAERKNPNLLSSSPSRRRRIAAGSGHQEKDVGKLVSDFTKMRSMMQQMGRGGGFPGMGGGMPGMGGGFPGMGGGMPGLPGLGGGAQPGFRAPSNKKQKAQKKKKGFGQL